MAFDCTILREIDIAPSAHVVICVARNEALRLPYLLGYYRSIGFDTFIVIDNNSTDSTREFLLRQPDTFVISAPDSFGASGFGIAWINTALDLFCDGRWILIVDADEIFLWPGGEGQSVRELTSSLDASGSGGVFAMLIDMYSDRPFGQIGYTPGQPFINACPFFDARPYFAIEAKLFPHRQIYGGVRARLFEQLNVEFDPPTVSKLPLVRWRRGQRFSLCAHGVAKPLALAPMRASLLHFKMFDDIVEKCAIEVARKEHFDGAREYVALGQAIERAANRSFYDPRVSVRYEGTAQLVALDLMSATGAFDGLKPGALKA
jgi:glycosyltransferase involved in cell wall biosynthesis